jgi:CheY-like chemotaxis protein
MSNRIFKVSCFLLLIICWATHSLSSHSADELCPCDQSTEEVTNMTDCQSDINRIRSFSEPSPAIAPPPPSFRRPSAPVGKGEKVVLLIEDNSVIKRVFERQFTSHVDSGPFKLKTAPNGEAGIKIFIQDLPIIIFVDYELGADDEMNGTKVILEIKRLYNAMYHKDFPGTFVGFSFKPELNREMLLAGASHAIQKAMDIPLLNKVFGMLLNSH